MPQRLKWIVLVLGALGFVAVVVSWFPLHARLPLRAWDLRLEAGERREIDLALPEGTRVTLNGWFHAAAGTRGDIRALDETGAEIERLEGGSGPLTLEGPIARFSIGAEHGIARVTIRVLRAEVAEELVRSEWICDALLVALLFPLLAVLMRPLSRWMARDRSTSHLRRRIGWIGVVIVALPILAHVLRAFISLIENRYAVVPAVRSLGFLSWAIAMWADAGVVLALASLERRAIGGRLLEIRASLRGVLLAALAVAAAWLLWKWVVRHDPALRWGPWRLGSLADFPAAVLVAISAGVCEEVVFRGFLLTRLRELTESPTLALLATSLAFALLHVYDSGWHALHAGVLGLLLGIVTLRTRNLYPAIWAHAANDILWAVGIAFDVVKGFG